VSAPHVAPFVLLLLQTRDKSRMRKGIKLKQNKKI
jgi:hypothetical protein